MINEVKRHLNIVKTIDSFFCGKDLVEPIEPVVEAISCQSAALLDIPVFAKGVEFQFVHQFTCSDCGYVRFVCENKQRDILQGILRTEVVDGILDHVESFEIAWVHYKHKGIGALKVVVPQSADFGLASDVPHCHGEVLVLDLFHIEPHCWHTLDVFPQFQFVRDCCFPSGIQTQHQHSGFFQTTSQLVYDLLD